MKKVNKIRMRETIVSYCFLAPVLVFFIMFVLAPMIMGLVTSFFNYTMTDFTFVGIDNYVRMFTDEIFLRSLKNTLIIVIGSVPVVVIFSLFVASQTYEKNVFTRSFFRCVFFLPVVTGSVAVTVVWKWIYDRSEYQLAGRREICFMGNHRHPAYNERRTADHPLHRGAWECGHLSYGGRPCGWS